MIRAYEIRLTIPDNEARTAFATLERLGVPLDALERATLLRADVGDGDETSFYASLRASETIFNPNKHALVRREDAGPAAGEVWIDEPGVDGAKNLERFTAWRLIANGAPAADDLVRRAAAVLLCNPAFQRATFRKTNER